MNPKPKSFASKAVVVSKNICAPPPSGKVGITPPPKAEPSRKRTVCEASSSSTDNTDDSVQAGIPASPLVGAGPKTPSQDPVPSVIGNVDLELIPIPRFLMKGGVLMVPKRHPNPRTSSLTKCRYPSCPTRRGELPRISIYK